MESPRVDQLSRVMVELFVRALVAGGVPRDDALTYVLALLRHCQARN